MCSSLLLLIISLSSQYQREALNTDLAHNSAQAYSRAGDNASVHKMISPPTPTPIVTPRRSAQKREFEEAVHNNVLPMLRTDRDVSADRNEVNTQARNVAGARLGPLNKAANMGRTLELHRCQSPLAFHRQLLLTEPIK